MDKVKIILENGSEAEVYSIFYLYNSKYYFMYTTKEIDSNGYVVLYLVQVVKELKNTPSGPVDTGYMVGVEIANQDEWKSVQESITKIVDDKKNNSQNSGIQYLPISMLSTLKIISKKTFRLMKSIIQNDFKLSLDDELVSQEINNANTKNDINENFQVDNLQTLDTTSSIPLSIIGNQGMLENEESLELNENNNNSSSSNSVSQIVPNLAENIQDSSVTPVNEFQQGDVIIDYRARFFEEQEKNQQLQLEIDELKQRLESIRQIVE